MTALPQWATFISSDELGDGAGIPLELKVNGEVRQSGNTDGLIWPVPRLIAYVSRFMTLWPGDVVSTGTPGGVGMGMKPPVYLKPGDVVEWGSPAFGFASQAVVIDDEGRGQFSGLFEYGGEGKVLSLPDSADGALFSRGTGPPERAGRQMTPACGGWALFSLDYFAAV